ncbi:MAG: thioesterase family protein [Chitinophagales bacterium]|nr:acyl-CoA thioesterase [Bacteroidota bacterium]
MQNFDFLKNINFPFSLQQQIAWGDMDALQHVNNVAYFRYFESGRVDFFNQANLWNSLFEENIKIVVVKLDCNYVRELTYPASIEIKVGIKKIGNSSMTVHHVITTTDQQLIAHGEGIIVGMNTETGKPTPWTEKIRAEFNKWI